MTILSDILRPRYCPLFLRIVVPVVLVLILAIGVLTWSSIQNLTASKREDLLNRNRLVTEQISFAVQSAFYTLNWDFIEKMLDSVIDSEEVLWLTILNPECEVYMGRGVEIRETCLDADVNKSKKHHEIKHSKKNNKKPSLSFLNEETFIITEPIAIGDEIWLVSLGGSLASINRQKEDIITNSIRAGLIVVLVSGIACLFISRMIVRPIEDLSQRAEEISLGKFNSSLIVSSHDEIGNLAAAFNKMSSGLQKSSDQNEDYRKKLEKMVEVRTRDLVQTTDHMTSILETSNQGFWQADNDGISEKVSPRMVEILGRKVEDIIGYSIFEFLDDANAVILQQELLHRGQGKKGSYELSIKKGDGTLVPCLIDAAPLYDNQSIKIGSFGMVSDITWLKEAEAKLRESRDKAHKANEAKSSFLANMSHDIRTPMNGIIGMTNLALDTELTERQHYFLKGIKTSADSLLGLLNDILDFSKIEAGQLLIEKQDFNLQNVLNNVMSMMSFSAREKGLELILQPDSTGLPVVVRGDELRLRQILINLIGNSIKFTENGSVELGVVLEPGENDKIGLHFKVSDTGIGIPAEKQESIFSSFSQADVSTTRKFGGTGLGLSISKQLVEMMAGEIWIENNANKGTVFHFTVFLEPGNEENILHLAAVDVPRIKALDILLVDDNNINCEIAAYVLEKDKHRIVTVENGLKSLQIIADQDFDLILMDVQMPVMDGLTASAIIRASEQDSDLRQYNLPADLSLGLSLKCKGNHIPIVAMTANAMEGDREKCLAAGMDNYLTKPFEPVQVRAVIADIIG